MRSSCLAHSTSLLALVALTLLSACRGCGPDTPPPPDGGVTPPLGPVSVQGRIVTLEEAPFAGAEVSLAGARATTDDAGFFWLHTDPAGRQVLVVSAAGHLPAERAVDTGAGPRVNAGTIQLMPVAASEAIDGAVGGSLSAGPMQVEIPAGAFTGQVRVELALVPVDDPLLEALRLPARIPTPPRRPIAPLFAFVLEASGQQPAAPLTVSVTPDVSLPPDLRVPVGRFDRSLAVWVDAALGTVAGDGVVRFSIDHLSTFAAALPAVPTDPTPTPDLDTLSRTPPVFPPGEPRVEPTSGALQVGVPLPPLLRRGREIGLTLFHDSRTVLPALEVTTQVPLAAPGEIVLVEAAAAVGDVHIEAVATSEVSEVRPATVTALLEAPSIAEESAIAEGAGTLETGPHPVVVEVATLEPAALHASASESFATPELGPVVEDAGGAPVTAPAPVAVRNLTTQPVAVDDRGESPFGPGWHLRGLTRLIQPTCDPLTRTLAGGFERPASVFGDSGTLFLKRVEQALIDAGVEPERLATPPHLAFSGGALHVAVHPAAGLPGASVWRLRDDGSAELFAGGGADPGGPPACEGAATELHFRALTGLAPGPGEDGVLLATDDCVLHVSAAGGVTRLAGRPPIGGATPGPGVSVDQVDFVQEIATFHSGADGTVWVVESYLDGPFIVRDRVLQPLRMRSNGPQSPAYAIDAQGVLVYRHHTDPCVYRHVDGLSDPELFPRCREGYPSERLDGAVEEATVGSVEDLSFDAVGNLWFIDGTFQAVRRLDPAGQVITVAGGEVGALAGEGGTAEQAVLGPLFSLTAGAAGELAVAGAGPVLHLVPIGDETLTELASGDGSVLIAESDGTHTRRLPDGQVERYDEQGLLRSRGLPGEPQLEYRYEAWNAPSEEERCGHPPAPPRLTEIVLSGETLFSFSYGGGRLERIRDAAGRETVLGLADGRPASILPVEGAHAFTYDTDGRIATHTRPGPSGTLSRWSYTYVDGRLVAAEVPGRGTLTWSPAKAESTVLPDALSPAGVARQVDAPPAVGTLPTARGGEAQIALRPGALDVADDEGNETELELDPLGRVTRRRLPDGSDFSLVRDAAGRVVEIHDRTTDERWRFDHDPVTGWLRSRTDPAGRVVTFLHDSEGRIVGRQDPGSATTSIEPVTSGAAAGLPARVVDPIGRETRIEYDLQGNATRFVLPGGEETLVERDAVGRATRVVRADGVVEQSVYDPFGGLLEQSWGEAPAILSTRYVRRIAGGWEEVGSRLPASALVSATDPAGRVWSWTRDASFMPELLVTPVEGETRQRFDAEGRRTGRTLADGSVESFTYDAAGRLESRSWSGPAQGASLSLTYDALGRVEQLTDPLLTEHRTFAPGVGWTSVSIVPGTTLGAASGFILRRTRVSASVERQELGPTIYTLHRGFDDRTERVELEWPAVPGSTRDVLVYTWDPSRTLIRIDRGNGVSTVRTLDAAGRVSRQEEIGPGGTTTHDYSYDAAGRPSSRTVAGVTRAYGYDALGRLASCSDTGELYGYDAAGARASDASGSYLRDAAGRLQSTATATFGYDLLGRRTFDEPLSAPAQRRLYRWGEGGRLSEVLQGATGAEVSLARYAHDGTGRRVWEAEATGEWRFGYLPDTDRPVRILDPAGVEWHLVHALSEGAFTLAVGDEGSERYVHTDPFGRVIGLSDEAGTFEWIDEDCFGRRLSAPGLSGPPVGLHGQLHDPATGLLASGARFYDPALGEFLSPDPAGLEGGSDPFGYAGGNPVIQADPGGRLFFVVGGALLAGALIFNEIKNFAESESVKKTKRSYQQMTNLEDDDALEEAEQGHKNLHQASDEGGETAIRCTKRAVEAITDPVNDADSFKDALQDAAGELFSDDPDS
ncbi:MAG: carboxypeptidase regulatory-like domain-containing protein [Deltaproteobacteria bacterium]|nr:carboxypeptidase regulatory-like domain-containing protein [Deltaproteobacteria bacterium]